MKLLTSIALLFVLTAIADETTDREVILKLVASLNDGKPHPEFQCHLIPAAAMSETTPPFISTRAIQFITPDVALVDAVNTQYGSVLMVQRVRVILVVKREGAEWKIAATRLPANCRPPRKR